MGTSFSQSLKANSARRGRVTWLAAALDELPPKDRADLLAALRNPAVRAMPIYRALRALHLGGRLTYLPARSSAMNTIRDYRDSM